MNFISYFHSAEPMQTLFSSITRGFVNVTIIHPCRKFSVLKASVRRLEKQWNTKAFPYDLVKPWNFQSPSLWNSHPICPASIVIPDYVSKGAEYVPPENAQQNVLKPERIAGMRKACRLARRTLNYLQECLKVGLTAEDLDKLAFDFIIGNNAYPSPLLYRGYPRSICTSVNNIVCHGIPDSRALRQGDIINVDVTVFVGGYYGDCSATFPIGEIDESAQRLIQVTEEARDRAISACHGGERISLIGEIISDFVTANGFSVVPYFCGHGIGEDFHMLPEIFHVPVQDDGAVMQPGQTFTIEPIVSEGSSEIVVLDDTWTAMSVDGSRSAQFEHTVLITETGAEVLTTLE